MKKLSSCSSTSSSTITTTASFDESTRIPHKTAAASCISAVLRRLLCRNSLPTYPSDHLKLETQFETAELVNIQRLKTENGVEGSAAPGVVARLMGLETLPPIKMGSQEKSPNSVSRSRSMNSVDTLKEIASIQAWGRYRRVRSFLEIPTFVELEDEEFLIFSFENEDKGMKTKQCKTEKSRTKSRRSKSIYAKNKENQQPSCHVSNENLAGKITMDSQIASQRGCRDGKPRDSSSIPLSSENNCSNSLAGVAMGKLIDARDVTTFETEKETRMRNGKKIRKDDCLPGEKIEPETEPENSSPNSVLDVNVFPCGSQISNSGEHSRMKNSKTRRTLTEELENYRKLNPVDGKGLISRSSINKSTSGEGGERVRLRKNEQNTNAFVNMWGEICRVVETQVTASYWTCKRFQKLDLREEVIGELELEIVNQLLEELIYPLFGK